MIRIDIMEKGDEFVGLFGKYIAIKKNTGEVELTEIILDENRCIRLGSKPEICIGFGHGSVEASCEDGNVTVVTF